jgi:hypothetical protein
VDKPDITVKNFILGSTDVLSYYRNLESYPGHRMKEADDWSSNTVSHQPLYNELSPHIICGHPVIAYSFTTKFIFSFWKACGGVYLISYK